MAKDEIERDRDATDDTTEEESKPAVDEDEDEGDDEGDDEDEGDDRDAAGEESAAEEDTDRSPPPPATATKAVAPAAAKETAARVAEATEPARPTGVRKRAPLPPDPPPAAVGKTVGIFVVVIGALSAGFWFLGSETGGDRTAPRWKTGQTVDVNITLVPTDRNDLACASPTVIADRRCEFEAAGKPVQPKPEDDKLLKPYTTTDGVQFLAAGLWSQAELDPKKLPPDRFSVKCKYTVEGEVKKPGVRWNVRGGFGAKDNNWYAGTVKNCALSE